jgi:spore germination cell wall hydrolase CwlJ-like protein
VSNKLRFASAISIAATMIATLLASGGSGAKAQDLQVKVPEAPGASAITLNSATSLLFTTEQPAPQPEVQNAVVTDSAAPATMTSLAEMVSSTPLPSTLSSELECLAGAIYFEAKSETLAGQLAVGRVIIARAHSGRFPTSYCGVVLQPSQFSFVRGRAIPAVSRDNRLWQQAAKIAVIADKGAWKSPVEGAMFFHAASVSPAWGKTRVARIDNHIFYR